MAKGNMLLGKSRGSVGDVVFTQVKGQQVARARNRQPANPRTLKQSFQRARFAAAVKFYTRGNQALYKFAFEGKRQVESDYNAFMRENVRRAPAISKAAFDNYDYPVCAPFVMSKGSLAPVDVTIGTAGAVVSFGVAAPEGSIDTIGGLSTALLTSEKFQTGDILTFVFLSSAYSGAYPSITADGSGKTTWTIRQFIIDTASEATIADVLGMTYAAADGVATLSLAAGTAPLDGVLNAFTCVHSRNTASGLKVSTQELVLDSAASTAYDLSQEGYYRESVAASWQTAGSVDIQPEAILQGSIAYDGEGGSSGFDLPVSAFIVLNNDDDQPYGTLTGSGPWYMAIVEGRMRSPITTSVGQVVPAEGFDASLLTLRENVNEAQLYITISPYEGNYAIMAESYSSSNVGNIDIDVLYDGQLVVNISGVITT